MACGACAVRPPSDPISSLNDPAAMPYDHEAAMNLLDATPNNPAYQRALRRIVVQPGYPIATRRMAFERELLHDRVELGHALELGLAKMDSLQWREELCQRIGELDWKEMTPTLIRAWARPMPSWEADLNKRAEARALADMWGQDRISDVLMETFIAADQIREANLRARCWEMLVLTGHTRRLTELLAAEVGAGAGGANDPMLHDLRRASRELGVLPRNREEVLWVQMLAGERHEALWQAAAAGLAAMGPSERAEVSLKDVPVIGAAQRCRPELLGKSKGELFALAAAGVEDGDSRRYSANFEGYGGTHSERLQAHEKELTWGDLLAIVMIREALAIAPVRAHIFEIADRDLRDISTEYGGIIRLDTLGRLEVVEFAPRIRGGDVRFEASNDMFEAGYAALSHFHLHCQAHDNSQYAGPHYGDFQYADATGVNGVVFTFIDSRTLNADYYRRGQVVVDMGTIKRPAAP